MIKNNITTIAFLLLFVSCKAQILSNAFNAKEKEKETFSVIAQFDEYDGETFNFEYVNNRGEELYLLFDKVSKKVLKKFDLVSGQFHGKLFEIIYVEEINPQAKNSKKASIEIGTTNIVRLILK